MIGMFQMAGIAAAAVVVAYAGGRLQGYSSGYENGENACQAKNQGVTDEKNNEIAKDNEAGAIVDDNHDAKIREAIRRATEGTNKKQQCTVLTDKERAAIDAIRD